MDYFVVILLVIIIFTFLSDKKLLSIKELECKIKNLNQKIDGIDKESIIISVDANIKENVDELIKVINEKLKQAPKKYIILKNTNVELTRDKIRTIIANYINQKQKMCGFIASYEYQYVNNKKLKEIFDELSVVGINYLKIFSKSNIKTSDIIIFKVEEITKLKLDNKKNNLITFAPSEEIEIISTNIKTNNFLKKLMKVYDSDIKAILKSAFLVVVGISVTTNLIHAIYLFDITQIVVAGILYWCYTYVLKYMYSPIGKYKVLSKYLLPIFFVIYLSLQVINSIKRRTISNKKVQAS